ncbi:MAG: amino acid ABC transporter permease [Hyphomicrobiales bacterium]|nr:amino acid ABC transporter permease [Hyphomicrobiales bacterium]MDE2018094.1 amino acid ABC transporter permease [Hyphomicrobiales bacterium]
MQVALDFRPVLAAWPSLLSGAAWTLGLTAVASVIGLAGGVAGAAARRDGPAALRFAVGAYVEAIRNTPFVVQLYFIFFALPALGLRLPATAASLLAMSLNLAAYATEIVRSGLDAAPAGQGEAAASLGMTKTQAFLHVLAPPALGRVWPSLVSQIAIVMLGSAVCGQISVPELSFAGSLIQSRTFRAFESFIVVAALYLAMAAALRRGLLAAGRRFAAGD